VNIGEVTKLAIHEFGIMAQRPGDERYDSYEPEKYCLIQVDDEDLEELVPEFEGLLCYWHTLRRPETNLDYCGITLIPPESAHGFAAVLRRHDPGLFQELIALFERARAEGKFIIHYGL